MKIKTSIALLTKGYSMDDIKEMSKIEGLTDKDLLNIAESGAKLADIKELVELDKEPEEEVSEAEAPAEDKEEDVDYKALYEKEHKALIESQKNSLSESIDPPEEKTVDEILTHWLQESF